MKKSTISFDVELDAEHIPEKITWSATDSPEGDLPAETKSISISIWDHRQKNTLRIDLWTKDMPVDEMPRYYLDCLGGMAQSLLNATGDTAMADEINRLCERLLDQMKSTSG